MGNREIFEYPQTGMVSGQGDAVAHTYEMVVGKSGRAWFIPRNIENQADHIHCTAYADWDKTGEGFAGAHLELTLLDGSKFTLKGGWHTNWSGLLDETGIDIRDKHLTYGAVGLEFPYNLGYYGMAVQNLIHRDEDWTLGHSHRIDKIALDYANEHDVEVRVVVKSRGGGHAGWVKSGDNPYWLEEEYGSN